MAGRESLVAAIHNTGWLLADNVLRVLNGVLVGAWVARYLGPSQVGQWSYVLSLVFLFGTVSALGLDSVVVRELARDALSAPAILGTVVRLRLAAGVVCWAGAVVTVLALRPGDSQALLLVSVVGGTIVLQSADTVDLWFQSQTQSKRTVWAKTLGYLCASVLKVVLILSKAPLPAFAVVTLIEAMLSSLSLSLLYRRFPAPFKWTWDTARVTTLLRESWPYLVAAISITIYMRVDQVMLRQMVGEHELGIYSVAIPISTAWYFIPMAIARSTAPAIARKKAGDPAGYERAIFLTYSVMWWMLLPLSIAVAALARPMVHLLYGDAFAASAGVLAIHVFTNIPVALGVAQYNWIVNERRNILTVYKTSVGAVSNIALNLVLIPRYGAYGAAMASVGAQCLSAVLSNLVFAPQAFRMQMWSLVGSAPRRG